MIPGLRVPRDTISMLIFRNSPGADDKEVFDYDTALSGYNVEWQDR